MDFAVISPTAGLERYGKLSKTHLILAPVYAKDEAYAKFYRERQRSGDFIILDNGGYEGEPLRDMEYVSGLKPDVVVLPDFYLQPWKKTWHAAIAHLDRWCDAFPDVEWLYIPQAEKGDMYGFISSYQEAAEDPRITWLGIPRCLPLHITDNPLARVEFARLVRSQHPRLHLHAFGMVNGDTHELGYLEQAGVTSIDSSAPVWRGWNGYDIKNKAWNGLPVDFSAAEVPLQEALIKSNLEACGVNTKP